MSNLRRNQLDNNELDSLISFTDYDICINTFNIYVILSLNTRLLERQAGYF